tara:strand:- start:45 stop:812 length:768 start_codon:yes stop_codon:yes gene_type:complete
MVMPADAEVQENIEEVQAEAPIEEPVQDASVEEAEVPVAPTEGQQPGPVQDQLPLQEQPAIEQQSVQPEQTGPNIQAELEQLHNMRQVNAQKEWESQVMKQAQAVERRAQQQGVDPQSAREIAKQHVSTQKQLRDQQGKDYDLIRNIEGRQNASLHFLEKYGLANKQMLEDYKALSGFTSPQDMEREAMRMSQIRNQAAEIARLKQGQVPPQAFDNSQGAAQPTNNQNRLLSEYISGSRSEAHQAAARRAAGMGS